MYIFIYTHSLCLSCFSNVGRCVRVKRTKGHFDRLICMKSVKMLS